jgi:hypothetical protein
LKTQTGIGLQAGQFEPGYTPSWIMFGPEPVPPQDIRAASPMAYVRPDFNARFREKQEQ